MNRIRIINDPAKVVEVPRYLDHTFTLRREQPKEVETAAGTVRFEVAERPYVAENAAQNTMPAGPDWKGKESDYRVYG